MGLTGDESAELPFLAIDPPERLFDWMSDQAVIGQTFRSKLFGCPVIIEIGYGEDGKEQFGDDFEAALTWAKISTHDSNCPVIEIGIDANRNRIGQDSYYFSAGRYLWISDDYQWDCLNREQLLNEILDYVRDTILFGFFEYWKGRPPRNDDEELNDVQFPIGGPLRERENSPGWLRRAIDLEKQRLKEVSGGDSQGWFSKIIASVLIASMAILLSPLIIPIAIFFVIPGLLRKHHPHARRYPPFPLN